MAIAPLWTDRPETMALAFRGYNVTNLGRSAELLAHPVYGPVFGHGLRELSRVAEDTLGRRIDLVERVKRQQETPDLSTYAEDIALVVGASLGQLRLLEEFFGVDPRAAKLSCGYSLGEAAALVNSGVFEAEPLLRAPLLLSDDVVALAEGVTLGVLFSRGPALDYDAVERLCMEITQQGDGTIAISAHLSPNTVLVLGQGPTLPRLKRKAKEALPQRTLLRPNPHCWPPLHTPITRQRSVPDRVAVMLETAQGGFTAPVPPIVSMVTGDLGYTDHNARELLHLWIDHPQRLWDVVYETLSQGVETVVHVGPEPNLLPATYRRLADNVKAQLAGLSWRGFGLRAMSRLARRRIWLSNLLSSRSALLRAPFVEHVVLEDWLLEQRPA